MLSPFIPYIPQALAARSVSLTTISERLIPGGDTRGSVVRNKSGEDIFLCPSGFKGVGRPFTEPTWMCTTGQHPRDYSSPSESTPPTTTCQWRF